MTVRFEFTVSDEDAENIVDIMDDAVILAREQRAQASPPLREWWDGRVEYLLGLKQRVVAGSKR